MKKYFLPLITLFMISVTTVAYIHENSGTQPQYKRPAISIESQKYGTIKKILWPTKYMNDPKSLIILSTENTGQGAISCLYNLNIDTGASDLLAQFPTHKNINNVLSFDSSTGYPSIIAAYDKGIIKVTYPINNKSTFNNKRIEIAGFDTATSMDYKNKLIYTRENDKLLYEKNIPNDNPVTFFTTTNNMKDEVTYFIKPLHTAGLDPLNNIIAYTSVSSNRIDLHVMQRGIPINTPIIKNVVSAKVIEGNNGIAGMNMISTSKSGNKLSLFILKQPITTSTKNNYYNIDTIPYNTDSFGAIPAVDSAPNNPELTTAYTSYDENHKGVLKICSLKEKPKVIVSSENIFGPISMNDSYILYFTMENNNARIKICDKNGKPVKDITDMITKK